jgi:hypothetical protein
MGGRAVSGMGGRAVSGMGGREELGWEGGIEWDGRKEVGWVGGGVSGAVRKSERQVTTLRIISLPTD